MNGELQVSTTPSTKSPDICDLHDSILSDILSRLPTKEAVRTSILSKDWKFRWKCIYHVNIDDTIHRYTSIFPDFMDRLFLQLTSITSFTLRTNNRYSSNQLKKWMSNVLKHKLVEVFEIWVGISSYNLQPVILPFSLLTDRTSLKTLRAVLPCIIKITETASCFPNLTSLDIHDIQFLNENLNIDTLSLNFPVLETLKTIYCIWVNIKFLEIYAPSLNEFFTSSVTGERHCSIKIVAPRLTKFDTCGNKPENIFVEGGLCVVYANLSNNYSICDLNLLEDIGVQVGRLLNGFSNLEELMLSGSIVTAWLSQGLPLPHFIKMRRLLLPYSIIDIEQVFELLHASPSLKYLSARVVKQGDYDYDAMESIPSCVIYHLEEVETWSRYTEGMSQIKFTEFLLKNGGELKKLSFHGIQCDLKRRTLVKKLSKFNRRQTSLMISFTFPHKTIIVT